MSSMIITENELRKYLYNSFLKKENSNILKKKNIKKFQHKNSLLKEEILNIQGMNLEAATAEQTLVYVVIPKGNDKYMAFFNNPMIGSGNIYDSIVEKTYFSKEDSTFAKNTNVKKLKDLEQAAAELFDGKEQDLKVQTGLTQDEMNLIEFSLNGDSGAFELKIPIRISNTVFKSIKQNAQIILGNSYAKGSDEKKLCDIFQAVFEVLKSSKEFQIKYQFFVNWESLTTYLSEEHENSIVVPDDIVLFDNSIKQTYFSNLKVFYRKIVSYAFLYRTAYQKIIMMSLIENSDEDQMSTLKGSLSDEERDITTQRAKFSEYLQDDRKTKQAFVWDTDQSFFNLFFLKNPGVQGVLDLANIGAAIAIARGVLTRLAWWVELLTATASTYNRMRYVDYLKEERAKLEEIKAAIESGNANEISKFQNQINTYYEKLQMAGVKIDSIQQLIDAIDEVITWERIYYCLDAAGATASIATWAKAGLFKMLDSGAATREIKYRLPVKPILDQNGKPKFKTEKVFDEAGNPVLDPTTGQQKTQQVQEFEPVNINAGKVELDGSKVIEKDGEYYAVLTCFNPESDKIFKATIEEQIELAEEFFGQGHVKLSKRKEKRPKLNEKGEQVLDATGNPVEIDVEIDPLEELATQYAKWRGGGANDTIYLTSLDMAAAEGDELLMLFRLLGIASDPTLSKHIDAFKGERLKALSNRINATANVSKIPASGAPSFKLAEINKKFDEIRNLPQDDAVVITYLLSEYPVFVEIADASGQLSKYEIKSLNDFEQMNGIIEKMPDSPLKFEQKKKLLAGLSNGVDINKLKPKITNELDQIMEGIPKKENFKNTQDVASATAYSSATKEYLSNLKKIRVRKVDVMYDQLISTGSETLQKFLSNEASQKILKILNNVNGQMVSGNFEISSDGLVQIFKIMKDYNAKNQLYFMHLRLGQYGDLNQSAGQILKADVVENLLHKNSVGFEPPGAKTVEKTTGTIDTKSMADKANQNLAAYKDQVSAQAQKEFNIGGKSDNALDTTKNVVGGSDDFVTDTYRYNQNHNGNLNVEQIGQIQKTYQQTNINLVRVMQEWNDGVNAQLQALTKLQQELKSVSTTLSLQPSEMKVFNDLQKHVDDSIKSINDYKVKAEKASFYSNEGLQRSKFTYSPSITGANQQAAFGSTGRGVGGIFGNSLDLSNRQLILFENIIQLLKFLRATADSTGSYILNKGNWRTLSTTGQLLGDKCREAYAAIKSSAGFEKYAPAELIKDSGFIATVNKITNFVSDSAFKSISATLKNNFNTDAKDSLMIRAWWAIVMFVARSFDIYLTPIRLYIKEPLFTGNIMQGARAYFALQDIVASNDFRMASEFKLKEQMSIYSILLPKLTAAIVFNGRKAQFQQLKDIMLNGLSNYQISHLKVLNSFKLSMEKNVNEMIREKQKEFIDNPEKSLQLIHSASNDPKLSDEEKAKQEKVIDGQTVQLVEKMMNESGIVLKDKLNYDEDDTETAAYSEFLKTYSSGEDSNIPVYLDKKPSYANRYTIIPLNEDQAMLDEVSKDSNEFLTNVLGLKDDPLDNWKTFHNIITGEFNKLNVSETEQEEGDGGEVVLNLFRSSFDDLKELIIDCEFQNETIFDKMKYVYGAEGNYQRADALEDLRIILIKGYFYVSESNTYLLSDTFKSDYIARNPTATAFYNELLRQIKILQKRKSSVISKELFTVPLSSIVTKTVKGTDGKDVKIQTEEEIQIGLAELIDRELPNVVDLYSKGPSGSRYSNIDKFVNSIRRINGDTLRSLTTDNDLNLGLTGMIITLKNKETTDRNKLLQNLCFLDFISILKNHKSSKGQSFYNIIINSDFLKVLDGVINYYGKGTISLSSKKDGSSYRFVLTNDSLTQITNATSQQEGHWSAAIGEIWYKTNLQILHEILDQVWNKYFADIKQQAYPITKRPASSVFNINERDYFYVDNVSIGKTRMLRFLKVLRMICLVKKADYLFKSLRSGFEINNKNFLDITSVVTGGINSFDISDIQLEGYDPNSEETNQANYAKNIKAVIVPKIMNDQDVRKVAQSGKINLKKNRITVNPDYYDTDSDYLTNTFLNPDTGFENMIATQVGVVKSSNISSITEFTIKSTAEEILNLQQLKENYDRDIGYMYKWIHGVIKKYIPIGDKQKDYDAKLSPVLDESRKINNYKKSNLIAAKKNYKKSLFESPSLIDNQDNQELYNTVQNKQQPQIQTSTPKQQLQTQEKIIKLSKDQNEKNLKSPKLNISSGALDEMRIQIMMKDPAFQKKMSKFLKDTAEYDINYSLKNLLKIESFENSIENFHAVKELSKSLKISKYDKIFSKLSAIENKKEEIIKNLKFLEENEKAQDILNGSAFKANTLEYISGESELEELKKKKGLNSDFYKIFNKTKDSLFSFDKNQDPSKSKSFDIIKNQRSIAIAQFFNKKIDIITNLTKKEQQINVEKINNDIYQSVLELYSNAEGETREEGQNYLDFLKSIIQREFTEINVNSNIIGYELNDETQNIQKLVLVGDIQKLVTEQFDNEFFINLPIIYEINLESVYQKDPNFSFKVENLKKKTTNLKQDSFNYDYYQIIDDTKTLAQALVKNKVLTMEFVGKIFEV